MGFWQPIPAASDTSALDTRITALEDAAALQATFTDATGLGASFAVEDLRVEATFPGGASTITWTNSRFTTESAFALLIDQATVPSAFGFAVNALNGSAEFRRNSTSGDLNVRIIAFP